MSDPSRPGQERVVWGWVALSVLFTFLVFRSLVGYFGADNEGSPTSFTSAAVELKSAMALRGVLPGMASSKNDLASVESQVRPKSSTNSEAAAILLAAEREEGKPPSSTALAQLRKGKAAAVALGQIYGSPKLSPDVAEKLIAKLPPGEAITEIATVHAREAAGNKDARKALLPTQKLIFAAIAALILVLGGFAVGIGLVVSRASGSLTFAGHPLGPVDDARVDRLAIRGFQMVCLFLGLNLFLAPLIQLVGGGMPAYGITLAVAMIGATVWLFQQPVAGQALTLRDVGVTTDHLGRDILIGLTGFFANIPLLIFAITVGSVLMRFLPASHHPVTEMLMGHPNPLLIAALFIQASVLAPFWEEICFRGLLFPALGRRFSSVLIGGFTSSLLFASIHPQGIPLWLGLGFIGAMSCGLAQYSKSLIPSMVMHGVHNGVTLAAALLMTR